MVVSTGNLEKAMAAAGLEHDIRGRIRDHAAGGVGPQQLASLINDPAKKATFLETYKNGEE